MPGRGGAIPIVQHLGGQNGIQQESGDISVQDQLVIHLLQRCVDSHQAAEQVVEDGEGGQLTCATLAVHGQDLGKLARDAECACTSLEAGHLSIADKRVRDDQGIDGAAGGGEECTSLCASLGVGQNQYTDDHILNGNQTGLAVRAEREAVADVIRQRNDKTGGFEEVAAERQTLRGLRLDQFDDLGHLDDGSRRDDDNSESFRYGERHAFWMRGKIEIEDKAAVAGSAEQIDDHIVERSRQVGRDGQKVWLERIQHKLLDLFHLWERIVEGLWGVEGVGEWLLLSRSLCTQS